ncbi:MAG: hypothetical protein RIE53_06765 [Rhodothermales bacterium]
MVIAQSRTVHVESEYPQAIVVADGKYIGRISESPFRVDASVRQILLRSPRVTAWNAQSILLDLPEGDDVRLRADFSTLRPAFDAPIAQPQPEVPVAYAQPDVRKRRWIDVVSLSGAVVAGALAVHYRTKADNRFEDWEADKRPQLKRDIQRLDVLSGVSTGVMQVGIGVFAFRLVF